MSHAYRIAILLLASYQTINSLPTDQEKSVVPPSARSLVPNCEGAFDPTCLKINFLSFIEKLSTPEEYTLVGGLTIVKKAEEDPKKVIEKLQEISRAFPDDPGRRVDSFLIYKVKSFLENHTLKLKTDDSASARGILDYYDDDDDDDDGEFEDDDDLGRMKRKRKKGLRRRGGLMGLMVLSGVVKAVVSMMFTGLVLLALKKAFLVVIIGAAVALFLLFKGDEERVDILSRVGHAGRLVDKIPANFNIELPDHLARIQN